MAVSATPRPTRSNSGAPSSSPSWSMRRESADCERPSAVAASVTAPCSATASKERNSVRSIHAYYALNRCKLLVGRMLFRRLGCQKALRKVAIMLEQYRTHAAERAAQGIVPLPLVARQVRELCELLLAPPAGEEAFL